MSAQVSEHWTVRQLKYGQFEYQLMRLDVGVLLVFGRKWHLGIFENIECVHACINQLMWVASMAELHVGKCQLEADKTTTTGS